MAFVASTMISEEGSQETSSTPQEDTTNTEPETIVKRINQGKKRMRGLFFLF